MKKSCEVVIKEKDCIMTGERRISAIEMIWVDHTITQQQWKNEPYYWLFQKENSIWIVLISFLKLWIEF